MPWSGAAGAQVFSRNTGAFSGASCWAQSDAAARGIRSDDHDTHDQDIADGVSATLKKDGGNTVAGNIRMGGFKLTGLAAGTAAGESLRFEQLESGVMTTRGDMLYRSVAGPARLPKGINGQVLRQGVNDPSWATLGTASLYNAGQYGGVVPLLNSGGIWSAGVGFEWAVGVNWMTHHKAVGTAPFNSWISHYFFDGSTIICGSITNNAGSPLGSPGATHYNTSSDGRFKQNQRPLDDWEEIVDQLQPKYWRWGRGDHLKADEDFGLVAQDVYAIPQLRNAVVKGDDDPNPTREAMVMLDDERKPTNTTFRMWQMQKGGLEGVAFAAIKGLLERVRELEARA